MQRYWIISLPRASGLLFSILIVSLQRCSSRDRSWDFCRRSKDFLQSLTDSLPLRLQHCRLSRQPFGLEALVGFLEFWIGLAVRYLLPRRQRMECPPFGLVRDLLLGGPFWFDHLVFAFGRSTRMSRNSSGPLSNRRFRLAVSSTSVPAVEKLSITLPARAFALSARAGADCLGRVFTVRVLPIGG